jgi:hypothetical protein
MGFAKPGKGASASTHAHPRNLDDRFMENPPMSFERREIAAGGHDPGDGFLQRIGGGLSGGSAERATCSTTRDGAGKDAIVMVGNSKVAMAPRLAVHELRQAAVPSEPSGQQGQGPDPSAGGMSPAQGIDDEACTCASA